MEKTIGYLNSKIWYRFIKVLYISCFLIVLVIALFISYEYKPREVFDNEKSYIQCNNGIIYNLKENQIYLFSGYIGSYDDKKFREWCYNKRVPAEDLPEVTPQKQGKIDLSSGEWEDVTNEYLPATGNYKLISAYKTEGAWSSFVTAGIISIITNSLVFEIIRRIFYYIVLGSIFPQK